MTDSVGLAVSIASGLVKLGARVDLIIAEEIAVRSKLGLGSKRLVVAPPAGAMKRALQGLLDEEVVGEDPLAEHRAELAALVGQANPDAAQMLSWLQRLAPETLEYKLDDPQRKYRRALEEHREAWNLEDADIRAAAFFLGPNDELREQSMAWQLGLAVVDALAEFAVDNQQWIVRDDRARPVVAAVLERFASPQLDQVGTWKGLFGHVLRSTLFGVLDARHALGGDQVWLEGLLSALADARKASDDGEEYVIGLLRGRGYRALVGELLEEGSEYLGREEARLYERILADVLEAAAPSVRESSSFAGFFEDHWTDLARAGLRSFHAHGAKVLEGQDPLLREALLAMVDALAQSKDRDFLSSEIFASVVESAVSVVAERPELLDAHARSDVLRELLGSVARVVQTQGLRNAVSPAGLERVLQASLATLAEHPELLVRKPGIAQEVVGRVLSSLAAVEGLRAEPLAVAAARGALAAAAENPDLLDTPYAQVFSALAGSVGRRVREGELTRIQAGDLLEVAAEVVASNPGLLARVGDPLAERVLGAVITAAGNDPAHLVRGRGLVLLMGQVLGIVSMRGAALLADGDGAELAEDLKAVIQVGLELASDQVGRSLNLDTAPLAVSALVARWAGGELPTLDPNEATLQALFTELAEDVASAVIQV